MIVGGGPTGVDLAGEIAVDYLNKKITLVHKGYGLLEFLRVKASKKTLDWLQSKHVEVKLEQTINLEDVADGNADNVCTLQAISPNSQEKLCQAMKSTELPDDMDLFKCKEKLYFGEPAENTFSSTKSDVSDNKPSLHPQRATPIVQNIVKSAIKSATKTEETAKKWLSMMSRDCNRFCKIMLVDKSYEHGDGFVIAGIYIGADIQLYAEIANWTGLLWILDKFDDWYLILNMSSKYTCADIASWTGLLWILDKFDDCQENTQQHTEKNSAAMDLIPMRKGRVTVATGHAEQGTVQAITAGDNVGLLLRGISRTDIQRGH
ncbi:FAD/NAD(P)-binding oxidoreductase family protein, partial [Tanacetum coccineum]